MSRHKKPDWSAIAEWIKKPPYSRGDWVRVWLEGSLRIPTEFGMRTESPITARDHPAFTSRWKVGRLAEIDHDGRARCELQNGAVIWVNLWTPDVRLASAVDVLGGIA